MGGAWAVGGGVWCRSDLRDRNGTDHVAAQDLAVTLECPRNPALVPGARLTDAATGDVLKITKVEDNDSRARTMRIDAANDDRLSCVYSRGAVSVTVLVTPNLAEARGVDATGAIVDMQISEFMISVTDLVLSGGRAEPRRGDTLNVLEPDGTNTYELRGDEPFGFTDARRRVYRVSGALVTRSTSTIYLVDPDGLYLVDPDGRRLVA